MALQTPSGMPRITVEELQGLLRTGERVAILDVRSSREYAWMHIAGALHAPPEELDRLGLPPEAQAVTY